MKKIWKKIQQIKEFKKIHEYAVEWACDIPHFDFKKINRKESKYGKLSKKYSTKYSLSLLHKR